MPLLVREEIERLFRTGVIQFLVCTSTLLEGVNLPCQNLFVRAPKKGNNAPMSSADFWNLAGRAGRWGLEFQGNIVCIDASDPGAWSAVPTKRVTAEIERATDAIGNEYSTLLEHIALGSPVVDGRGDRRLDSLVNLLTTSIQSGDKIRGLRWNSLSPERADELQSVIESAALGLKVPARLWSRHATVSPQAMDRMLSRLRGFARPTDLRLPLPEARDAWRYYAFAIGLVATLLGGTIGPSEKRHNQLAFLLISWMRGRPLAQLINERATYQKQHRENFSLASSIREVMNDVEQFARFEAPTLLACFQDLLELAVGGDTETHEVFDLAMMLEMGVSRTTELSLMTLGLSRTSAVAIGEYITDDEMSPADAIEFLSTDYLDRVDLPAAILREARNAIARSE
jgi:hypothetical protein